MTKIKMRAALKSVLSTAEVAEALDCGRHVVRRMVPELIENGLARNNGNLVFLHKDAIEFIKNKPEQRGRKPDSFECVSKCMCDSCVKSREKRKQYKQNKRN